MADIASEERLWEFQTRLMENVTGIVSEYRSNSGAGTSRATSTYNTYGGTIPPTMTAKIGPSVPTINTTGSASLLSQEDSSENYKFIDLPVSIVQLLVPKVEVYKVYPSEIEGQPDRAYLLHQGAHKSEDIRKELREGTITATDSNRRGVVLQAVDSISNYMQKTSQSFSQKQTPFQIHTICKLRRFLVWMINTMQGWQRMIRY